MRDEFKENLISYAQENLEAEIYESVKDELFELIDQGVNNIPEEGFGSGGSGGMAYQTASEKAFDNFRKIIGELNSGKSLSLIMGRFCPGFFPFC